MVHQKNADTQFDFDTEGIRMILNDDWVQADGTTLGADNGIGVASIMAILSSTDIDHPAIEALFTIDEETGMTGALGLAGGLLSGSILLNLDTEDDDELTIGCAGGVDVTSTGSYDEIEVPAGVVAYKLGVTGLTGGHSGADIHLGRGNANKLMNRWMTMISKEMDMHIGWIDGGGLRNALPRESFSCIVISPDQTETLKSLTESLRTQLAFEYQMTDSDLTLSIEETDTLDKVMSPDFSDKFLWSIYACPNGVYRMSPDIPDLVQTSNNVARVVAREGQFKVLCLTRSSVDSEKMDMAESIASSFRLVGADIEFGGSYPGWAPKPSAPIIKTMTNVYRDMFDEEPHVNAIHAGLECGIIGGNYSDMDMISFGPNIRGAHSPDEKVQISSVQKYWKYFLEVLRQIPKK